VRPSVLAANSAILALRSFLATVPIDSDTGWSGKNPSPKSRAVFTSDGLVNDIQREFRGKAAIGKWAEREIFGANVTMEVMRAIDHYGDVTVTAKLEGTYDKTGLPDPLILTFYFIVRDDKIIYAKHLDIVAYVECDAMTTRGGHLRMTLTTGEELDIDFTPVAPSAMSFVHGIACVDTLSRITDLYSKDPVLSVRLADALMADSIVAGSGAAMAEPAAATMAAPAAAASAQGAQAPPAQAPPQYAEIVRAAAGFLRQENGPQVAVFDTTGWDTHANEGGAEGQLAGRLAALDKGLATLKTELGATWKDTAVLLVTEFGRTAAINGTRGTDHGTATMSLLVGGAVAGGRVVADWPGLSGRALYQGRDLMPTLDLRCVLKGVLEEHLGVPAGALDTAVFPGSERARALRGLVRT